MAVAPEPRCIICGCTDDKACEYTEKGVGLVPCSWLIQPGTVDRHRDIGLCDAPTCQHAGLMKLIELQRPRTKMAGRR